MEQCSIAFVGLEEQTVSACMSMIGIMEGMASVEWSQSTPSDADVWMIASDQGAPDTTKPYVVVYRNGEPKPASRYSLSLPFRAMQLMELLEQIVVKLKRDASSPELEIKMEAPVQTQAVEPPQAALNGKSGELNYKLWQQIADLMVQGADEVFYSVHTNAGCIYLAPNNRVFCATEEQIQQLESSALLISHVGQSLSSMPQNLVERPVFLLAWYAPGAADSLLLWLRGDVRFKLQRWPHLGFFPRSRERLTLCALLSKHALTFEQLITMTAATESALTQFLNACAVNGLLHIEPLAPNNVTPLPTTATPKKGRFGSMIKSLRSRLGLQA